MNEYLQFVDWIVSSIPTWWNFVMSQHFIFKAILLTPFILMIVGLIYKTFHAGK